MEGLSMSSQETEAQAAAAVAVAGAGAGPAEPTATVLEGDSFDLDMFNSIMQEPVGPVGPVGLDAFEGTVDVPKPNVENPGQELLLIQPSSPSQSFEHAYYAPLGLHLTGDDQSGIQETESRFAYVQPASLAWASSPTKPSMSTIFGTNIVLSECKTLSREAQRLEDDQDDGSSSFSPDSSQSDTFSQPSELTVDMQKQDMRWIQRPQAMNMLEDLKSPCIVASSADKVLVDLTADSDSDFDDDLAENYNKLTGNRPCDEYNSFGKRMLPWDGQRAKPSKDICVLPSATQEVYNVDCSFNQLYYSSGIGDELVPHNLLSSSSFMRHIPPLKLEPSLLNTTERAFAKGVSGSAFSNSLDWANGRKCVSTTGLQDTAKRLPLKDSISGHVREDPLKGLSKMFDGSALTEESFLEEGVMAVSLLKHQRIALAWMEKRERGAECAGGILADDQGLGKTISTIALILKVKPPAPAAPADGSNQLICEPSTVDLDEDEEPFSRHENWFGQLEQKCTLEKHLGTTVVSRGRLAAGTLVVCPTSVLRQWAQEIKEKVAGVSVLLYHGSNRTRDPSDFAKHDIVLTTYSIVSLEVPKQPLAEEKEADERNPCQYGLTGSLSSQQNVVKKASKGKRTDSDGSDKAQSGPLAKVVWFRVVLDEAQNIKNRKTQAARACWGLRAKRRWCLSGTPIQNTIEDLYSYFRFLKYEPFSVYRSFRSEVKDPITRDPVNGYKKLQFVLQKVLLRRTKTTRINGEPVITLPTKNVKLEQVEFSPQERDFYSNLEVESRKQFQMYAAAGTVQRNYVNILWMLLRLRQACNHPRLVKAHHSDAVPQSTRESASKLSDEQRATLLSVLERNGDTCCICMDAPEDAVVTLCGHVFCSQCLCDRLTHDDAATCPYPKCHARVNSSAMYSLFALKFPNGVTEWPTEASSNMLSQASSSENVREASSKIEAVMETLRMLPRLEVSNGDVSSDSEGVRTEKAIVFSQWTSMLDLLESSLKKEGFCYRRLDGTMSIQARDRALSDFKLLPKVTVIIMSLKAASLGLNMVTASHVLLIDVWWNPTTEDQAVDRAHRIGQTREVHVSRFTVKNTIEDRILALQERKRQMVASAFGEDAGTEQKTRLTVEEMSYLFRV